MTGITSIEGVYFFSELNIKEMVLILRTKLANINWKVGDSDYEGYYVLGHSKDKIRIKITTEDETGNYYLGIYFWKTHGISSLKMKRKLHRNLQKEVLSAIEIQIIKSQNRYSS